MRVRRRARALPTGTRLAPEFSVATALAANREAALRDWIREHKVTWETHPHYEMHAGGRVLVGMDLTLLARHPDPLHADPGCPECDAIHRALREIALAVVPQDEARFHVDIEPYRPALHMRPQTAWAPEIELDLEIYGSRTFAPMDQDEEHYVREVEHGLLRLGAQARNWS
jgi:hypothetical protein